MPKYYTTLWYHLVWSTKYRKPLLENKWRGELYQHIKEYCQYKGYHLDSINGIEDHIHLLVSLKPTVSISDIVRNIKSDSYHWLVNNMVGNKDFGWQDGYGAFSISHKQVFSVRQYIQRQEEHHRKKGFDEEYAFFKTQIDK